MLFIIWFGLVLHSALSPSWFFQGTEQMRTMTLLHVIGRTLPLLGMVMFVKSPSDDRIAAAMIAGGPALAGAIGLAVALVHCRMKLFVADRAAIARALASSGELFVSTLSANLYTTTITVILGFVASNSAVSAYVVADKCARACAQLIAPFSAAVYPRIVKLYGTVSIDVAIAAALRFGVFIVAAGVAGTALLLAASPVIVPLFLGHQDESVLHLLRIAAFLPAIISISNVFGVQILMAMGVTRALISWQLAVAVAGLPLTYAMSRAAAATGAAWSALALEILISVGFSYLAYRKVLRSAPGYRRH
jgi:PST family polysaccharide transporter